MKEAPFLTVRPGSYDPEAHFYPRVPNAQLHPLVRFFLSLGNERIIQRYCHLHPEVDSAAVRSLLTTPAKHFRWSGADLFHVTDDLGRRQFVVIETNSCPSGQKSMPVFDLESEQGGYRRLLERSFLPMLKRRQLPKGRLAVLWDKNWMEVSGYAAVLADLTGEDVLLVRMSETDQAVRCSNGVLHAQGPKDWVPLRAAFRYVTQRPWTRIPPTTRTALLNPVLCCLAGGRNKMLAAKAYDLYNAGMHGTGLQIGMPETIGNVRLEEVPMLVDRMGGVAVVKNPYSNAGQGVYTIARPADLEQFMGLDHRYTRFIVQGLIGNVGWSSVTRSGRLYHVGTVPSPRNTFFVADLRFMVGAGPEGFYPLSLYARRARAPLATELLEDGASTWEMLGTNLSVRQADGSFTTESERLMLMDSRDFNRLGIGLDDLCEAYVQTVMSTMAVDSMASRLLTQKGRFRKRLFASVNPDDVLSKEIIDDARQPAGPRNPASGPDYEALA